MKKKNRIRLLALAAGLTLTLFGLWADARMMLKTSQTDLEYSYRRALNDLTDYVSGMEFALEKAPYVTTPVMQNQISAKLLEQSGGAKAAMAVLPLSGEKADKLSRFLSQTGDYALYLSRLSAAGQAREELAPETLAILEEYARQLSQALQEAQARLNTERLSISRTRSVLNNVEALEELPVLDDDLDQVSQAFSQFPTLLYDGPFSDHIRQRKPLALEGEPELSETDAARKAGEFLHCPTETLTCLGEGGSQLPVYAFTCGDSHVTVTRRGGKIAYFKKAQEIDSAVLGHEEALEKALQTLEEMGLTDLRESYYVLNDNLCTINFAWVHKNGEDEVLCYPDLIRATLELKEGGMVEFDAAGYLMNHRDREHPSPVLTREEAQESVSPLLEAEDAVLALIPTPGLDEVLCWEVRCRQKNAGDAPRKFLVYLNAQTGLEEQLYQLREDDHGVLVS